MSIIRNIKDTIRKVIFTFVKPEIVKVVQYNSYAQAGEDAVLHFLFNDKKIRQIYYLDIGTNKPDLANNTYLFYLRGSRGVCVEADSTLIDRIKTVRPEDKILNRGVNLTDGNQSEADFYIFDEPSLNTFDRQEAIHRQNQGTFKIVRIDKVKLISLADIIDNYCTRLPDLLSIDIEGLDLAVLKSIDLQKYPIPVICAETCTYSENHIRPKDNTIIEYMLSQGYFVYADTYINTIFVNQQWFNQV
jgi:FkbM family methyltransferase